MSNELLNSIGCFVVNDIAEVYNSCFMQLTEERTAIIYHCPANDMFLLISVEEGSDDNMNVIDIVSHEKLFFYVEGDSVLCNEEGVKPEIAEGFVKRYLDIMAAFVDFADREG